MSPSGKIPTGRRTCSSAFRRVPCALPARPRREGISRESRRQNALRGAATEQAERRAERSSGFDVPSKAGCTSAEPSKLCPAFGLHCFCRGAAFIPRKLKIKSESSFHVSPCQGGSFFQIAGSFPPQNLRIKTR